MRTYTDTHFYSKCEINTNVFVHVATYNNNLKFWFQIVMMNGELKLFVVYI